MVVIRLALRGAKKRPFYHIVAADKRCARGGKHIEQLGYFNPIASGPEVRLFLDMDRVQHWLDTGAQPSAKTKQLIKLFKKDPISLDDIKQRFAPNEVLDVADNEILEAAAKKAKAAPKPKAEAATPESPPEASAETETAPAITEESPAADA